MTIWTDGYWQTDGQTDPTLLSIELLSQQKTSISSVFHQLPTGYNYLKLQQYFTIVQLQKLVVAEQLTDIMTYRAAIIANWLTLQPIELLSDLNSVMHHFIVL